MHMMRNDHTLFKTFGEVYFSTVNPGAIKGWKRHKRMTQMFAVPIGGIELVLFDDRLNSPTRDRIQEIHIGENHYRLVRIPPMIWYAFRSSGPECALIANCTDIPYEPEESESIPSDDGRIPYRWEPQTGE